MRPVEPRPSVEIGTQEPQNKQKSSLPGNVNTVGVDSQTASDTPWNLEPLLKKEHKESSSDYQQY